MNINRKYEFFKWYFFPSARRHILDILAIQGSLKAVSKYICLGAFWGELHEFLKFKCQSKLQIYLPGGFLGRPYEFVTFHGQRGSKYIRLGAFCNALPE